MAKPFHVVVSCAGSGSTVHPLLRGLSAAAPTPEFWKLEVVLEPAGARQHPSLKRVRRRSDALVAMLWWEDIDAFIEAGLPVVRIGQPSPSDVAPSVVPDDQAVGRIGAGHLLELGLRRLAFVGPCDGWSRRRGAGFLDIGRDAGVELHVAGTGGKAGSWDWDAFDQGGALERWVPSLPRPIGVMCAADWVAEHVMAACLHHDIRVPDEVAILGVDNSDIRCDFAAVPLSSIDLGMEAMARQAGGLLVRMLQGQDVPDEPVVVPPGSVVQRASTRTIAVDDEYLRRALEFIRDRYPEGIGVTDILEEVPISRSSLERRFRDRLGRGPGEEIRRVRLEAARRLLAETDMLMVDIAVRTGFQYISYLSKSFKDAFGLTPTAYRRQHRRTTAPPV